jgi:hypothetical protein
MLNNMKFRLKDKIFFFIAIVGLSLAFYLNIFDSNMKDISGDWQGFSDICKDLSDGELVDLKIQDNVFNVEIAKS